MMLFNEPTNGKTKLFTPSFSFSSESITEEVVRLKIMEFVFPEFPTHVQTVAKKRAKYKDTVAFSLEQGQVVTTQQIVNEHSAGKPNFVKINANHLYGGDWDAFTKGKVVEEIKAYYNGYLAKAKVKPVLKSNLPVEIECLIRTTKDHYKTNHITGKDGKTTEDWDIDNLGFFYTKLFNDCLVSNFILPQDHKRIVKSSGKVTYDEVEDFNQRCLIFSLYDCKTRTTRLY